jgi:endoglucanase
MILAAPAAAVSLTGVNIAGGEFGGLKAVYATNYIYPDKPQMQAFRDLGVNVIRVPVRWERLQPVLNQPLDPVEMERVDAVIAAATAMGLSVILDIHNYARYARQPIGSAGVPAAALRDLWVRLATRYRGNDAVIFGLMNEPVRISTLAWAQAAQDAVLGIRSTLAGNLILVPGAYWSGAHSWTRKGQTPSNGEALAGLNDPANNFAFDFHQYFDANSSGTTANCISPEVAEKRLQVATDWLRKMGRRGFLSEFGISRTPECGPVLTRALTHLASNREWLGWTFWGSSAWFGSYQFNVNPFQSPQPPQLAILRPFLVDGPPR